MSSQFWGTSHIDNKKYWWCDCIIERIGIGTNLSWTVLGRKGIAINPCRQMCPFCTSKRPLEITESVVKLYKSRYELIL